jgi:DNA-binding transcriptional MerR regulator
MDKKQLLRSVAEKEYDTLDELVVEAARIIPHIAQEQKRYKVAVYPDERTVRYYITEGLVDRPSPSRDKPSRFNYRHLLQILAIKHLQAQYLPLTKIKDILAGLDEEQMEEIIIGGKEDYIEYSRISSPMRRRAALHFDINESVDAYPSEDISLQFKKRVPGRSDIPEEWLRISVTDDIELNIRSSSIPRVPGKRKEFLERLTAKLRIYLESEKKQGGV